MDVAKRKSLRYGAEPAFASDDVGLQVCYLFLSSTNRDIDMKLSGILHNMQV